MTSPRDPISLYVHIPFCTLKCSYCDFNSYAGIDDLMRPFVDALIGEFRLWAPVVEGRAVPTVFFGGGTPSLLPLPEVDRIMSALKGSFAIDPDAEVSFEANPGTVDLDYLRGLVTMGVNRLSFGVQSFHDDELTALDRIHSAEEARQGYRWARKAGFERINLDFIYGLPEQPLERWQATLEDAIELAPEHLSLYALTVEDGTKLAYDTDRGNVAEPDPDAQADMYEWAMERLPDANYRQYEISNWSRPNEECRHNLVYWHNGEWLGLGPGAHSHWGGFRFADVYSPKRQPRSIRKPALRTCWTLCRRFRSRTRKPPRRRWRTRRSSPSGSTKGWIWPGSPAASTASSRTSTKHRWTSCVSTSCSNARTGGYA